MRIFGLKDLTKQYVEETKLKNIVEEKEIQMFKVGELVLPHVRKSVVDLHAMMKEKEYEIWTVKPEHPFYCEEQLKKVLREIKKVPVKGIFINYKRDIERVYEIEEVLKKNNLAWVGEKEFILNRYVTYVKEKELKLLPKVFQTNYMVLYGYKRYGATFSKVYKLKNDFHKKLSIKKEDIKQTDHVCHISDIPILRKWLSEQKVKYANLKKIKGMTNDWFIVFDLKEKDWHKVRVKLTVEPPNYERKF